MKGKVKGCQTGKAEGEVEELLLEKDARIDRLAELLRQKNRRYPSGVPPSSAMSLACGADL